MNGACGFRKKYNETEIDGLYKYMVCINVGVRSGGVSQLVKDEGRSG